MRHPLARFYPLKKPIESYKKHIPWELTSEAENFSVLYMINPNMATQYLMVSHNGNHDIERTRLETLAGQYKEKWVEEYNV